MRTRTTAWIVVTVVLCLASFIVGRHVGSHGVITYSVNGWPTSFNRAWPTYGLPLAEDVALLVLLRAEGSTNAIPKLEALLDTATYDAICRRPLLQGRDLETLDKVLAKVARYREQYPRTADTSANRFAESQKEVDAFLRDFAK